MTDLYAWVLYGLLSLTFAWMTLHLLPLYVALCLYTCYCVLREFVAPYRGLSRRGWALLLDLLLLAVAWWL